MVREELTVRLNDQEYKNWLKAGRCLLILKDVLHPYTDHHMRAFHKDLLNQHALLRTPCRTASCKPAGNKLSSPCRVCLEWQKVILRHHRHPEAAINWANCFPPYWRTDHWELAKAYMPRGQSKVKGAAQCDASALLNLISFCKCFCCVDPKLVRQVIQYRNELMHSCEFRVKDEWIKLYRGTLKHFVQQLSQDVPHMSTVGQQIEDMLTVDLSICVFGVDRMDSAGPDSDADSQLEASAELVGQWEAELLQEMLQECLCAEDGVDSETQDTEQLRRLQAFLQANQDLREKFSSELQTITTLEVGQ
ncbi:uncharacterized protein CXorf38-like [Nematolebias whitei]|uniref:uncharacterized protein CXorf38-like n=1 Tax=Nematolebias whitei TaxID=451745 RepID=UPI001898A7D5|nr:uncharacterized protein CXorf38-like [Nematolebias whitei]